MFDSFTKFPSFQTILKLFVISLLIVVFIRYDFLFNLYSNKSQIDVFNFAIFNDSEMTFAMKKRYITSSFWHPADLGNMLFRFASLYGIGKNLGRIPYVNASIHLQVKGLTEISEYFPLMHEYIEVKIPHESLVTTANFSDVCCIYETPKNLEKYKNVKYLKLSANYLQSYKFFHQYQMDIKKLMECSNSFKQKADMIANKIWIKDKFSHKFCVHVRRGDFFYEPWPLETRMDFVNPAVEYIYKKLNDQLINDVSLLILGNDKNFIQNMTFPNLNFLSINNLFPYNTSRSFDMCFGIEYCDTLLISASSSTFGWWIGYLMKSQGSVYYNAIITKVGTHQKDIYDYDLFLPHWKKLLLIENGRGVIEESRWTIERKNITKKFSLF